MLGFVIVALTAIGTGIAALSILGHPGWLWQILAIASFVNAIATAALVLRRSWGRRAALSALALQIVGALVGLLIVAVVEIRDIGLDKAITLLVFIFVPVVATITAVSLVAAWSINRLARPRA